MADVNAVAEKSSQNGKHVRVADGSATGAGEGKAAAPQPARASLIDALPIWVSKNLRSKRSLKLLLRCWIVSWAALVLLLPHKSLSTLGNTAFFALLMTLLVPPNMPVQLYLLLITTVFFGLLFGWAISAAAMRAALAARDKVLLAETLQKVQSSVAGKANPDALYQLQIFQGAFLDARSSVVYGCFLGLGTFIFALMRAYMPKLILASIFGTIATDIYCAFGPLLPFGSYTQLNSVLTSAACGAAISFVAIVLIFPESTNHMYLGATSGILAGLESLLRMQNDVFTVGVDVDEGLALLERMHRARIAVQIADSSIKPLAPFLNLEFSYGRWNGDDVRAISDQLLVLIVRIGGFQSSARMVTHRLWRAPTPAASEPVSEGASIVDRADSRAPPPGAAGDVTSDGYILRELYARNVAAEAAHGVSLADLLPVVEHATRELRAASLAGLGAARRAVDDANRNRYAAWYKWRSAKVKPDATEGPSLVEAIVQLRATRDAFVAEGRFALLEPYAALLGSGSGLEPGSQPKLDENEVPPPLRTLVIAYSFASNLLVAAEALLSFLETIDATTKRRTHARLWAPKGLRAIGKVLLSHQNAVDPGLGEDLVAAEAAEADAEDQTNFAAEDNVKFKLPNHKMHRLDPDSSPPTNLLQKIASGIHAIFLWAGTDKAIFVWKYIFITIALWLPSVFKSSAHFYYVEKGVWALIMGQTSMTVYASDQLLNYVTRMGCTFAGLILGLLAWYIGCGHGNGNPYGLAASSALVLLPVLFVRLYAPPRLGAGVALGCATFALIVGYSWLDGHLPTISSPGIGWSVAWKRFVLVSIGAAASFIVMIFPLKSGRKAVRLRNAGTISAIADLYAGLVAIWVSTEVPAQKSEKDDLAEILHEKYSPEARMRVLGIATQLQGMREATVIAKWEGSIRGKWAYSDYNRLIDVQFNILANIALLGNALGHVSLEWRIASLHKTKMINPDFVAEVLSIFSHVSLSLRTGQPLPAVLPASLLDRLFYHNRPVPRHYQNGGSATAPTQFILDRSLDYVHYATAVMAVSQIAESVDELHRITTRLCGEIPLPGFGQWREDYERSRVLV